MKKSKNKQSSSLLTQALGVAKKLSSELQKHQLSPTTEAYELAQSTKIVEGKARLKPLFEVEKYESPQHMLRQQLPHLSQRFLGRHYPRLNHVASFISPDLGGKVSDYLFQWLNEFSSKSSLTEKILVEAGAKDIAELTQDMGRSQRLSQALIEQNKLLAATQGAITGATSIWGATIDIPASIVFALRTIYQTGRSHGFDLTDEADQDIVMFIFKEIDLNLVAEKQTLLFALKALKTMLETHDLKQFQQLLGSNNDIELIKKWLVNEEGQFKWEWFNHIPQVAAITKLSPIAGATVGGIYSWRFLQDVGHKAQSIFGAARFYLNEHPDEQLSPLEAYYKAETLLEKLSSQHLNMPAIKSAQDIALENNTNEVITNIKVQAKDEVATTLTSEHQLNHEIQMLADQYVVDHEHTTQQPALKVEQDRAFEAHPSEIQDEQKINIDPISNKPS